MKTSTFFLKGLRAIVALALISLVLFGSSCKKDDPVTPDPIDTTGNGDTTKPIAPMVSLGDINAGLNEVEISAKITPNDKSIEVSIFISNEEAWIEKKVEPPPYSGNSPIEVSYTVSELEAGTEYKIKMSVTNSAGTTESVIKQFYTGVSDYDGNVYKVVKIGSQVWLAENLKTTHYMNGEVIPNVRDSIEWGNLTSGGYCYYNNDPELGNIFGALYNGYTVSDPRGFIEGWHVATSQDWLDMIVYVGGGYCPTCDVYATASPKLIAKSSYWKNLSMSVSNASGFSALPNGARLDYDKDNFEFRELFPTEDFPYQSANWWAGGQSPCPGGGIVYINSGKNVPNSDLIDPGGCIHLSTGLAIRLIKN